MFDGTRIASLNAIVSTLIKRTCSKNYPEKLKFSQRKIPHVLRNQNKGINFFGSFFRNYFNYF